MVESVFHLFLLLFLFNVFFFFFLVFGGETLPLPIVSDQSVFSVFLSNK